MSFTAYSYSCTYETTEYFYINIPETTKFAISSKKCFCFFCQKYGLGKTFKRWSFIFCSVSVSTLWNGYLCFWFVYVGEGVLYSRKMLGWKISSKFTGNTCCQIRLKPLLPTLFSRFFPCHGGREKNVYCVATSGFCLWLPRSFSFNALSQLSLSFHAFFILLSLPSIPIVSFFPCFLYTSFSSFHS